MKPRSQYITLVLLCMFILLLASNLYADDVRQGDEITIVTPGTVARLCPHPGCGPNKHVTRIPEGTTLIVQDWRDFKIGTFSVRWFAVTYAGNPGWISIFDTNKAPN